MCMLDARVIHQSEITKIPNAEENSKLKVPN